MPDSQNFIGQRIGAYEIVSLLGRGGMAEVYRARQMLTGGVSRDVALKLIDTRLSTLPEFNARFDREAQTLVGLSHPHILKAFDYGRYQTSAYLVMELMPGGSLADLVRKGPMPYGYVLRVIDQIGEALDYAHHEGVIHRDLKPQNVLLDKSGNAFLTDFGIVKLLDESTNLTQSHSVIGTPTYMSPEQGSGVGVDGRSDLYSMGVMLFELLSGRVPFTADTPIKVLFKHAYEPPPRVTSLRPGIPAAMDQVLAKALAKAPGDRYQTAAALVADVKAAMNNQPVSAPPLSARASRSVPSDGSETDWLNALAPKPFPSSNDLPSSSASATTPQPRSPIPRILGIGALITLMGLLLVGGVLFGAKLGSVSPPSPTIALSNTAAEPHLTTAAVVALAPSDTATPTRRPPTATTTETEVSRPTRIPPTDTPTSTPTSTITPSTTPTASATATVTTVPPTMTNTASPSATSTPIPPSATPTAVPPTNTLTPTATQTPSATPIPLTNTFTPSTTPVPPSKTATPTPVPPTNTLTSTATPVPPSKTFTPTATPVPPSKTPVPSTNTFTPSATNTASSTKTFTPSKTATSTATLTYTPTATPTNSATRTPSNTGTFTPSGTPTPSITPTYTLTATPTTTETLTATITPTPSLTLTASITLTPSPTPEVTASPIVTERTDSSGIKQVYVPVGCFMMGNDSAKDPVATKDEQPQHQVCLSTGYWLDEYDVTNAAFAAFVKAGGYSNDSLWSVDGLKWKQSGKFTGPGTTCFQYSSTANQPQVCINFYEAEAYANWRGGRLPTEAEWEYAARGPDDLIYPWGNTFDQSKANTIENKIGKTTPVNAYPSGKSWVGAYDMAGNIWQWASDWYDSTYYSSSPVNDPAGPVSGQFHVLRGGSWSDALVNVRSAFRYRYSPDIRGNDFGFRIVTPASGSVPSAGTTVAPTGTVTVPATATPITTTSVVTTTGTPPHAGTQHIGKTGIAQVYVPAGCFMMGSDPTKDPNARVDETPQHQVCITSAFWLDMYDVTNAAFDTFVAAGTYSNDKLWSADGLNWKKSYRIQAPNANNYYDSNDAYCGGYSFHSSQPRVCVSYYEAEAYANWRNCRLPTEAEWEYAARGPDSLIYPWGNTFDNTKTNTIESNYKWKVTNAVNFYPAGRSWVGAYDMAGNVFNWVSDWYSATYYATSDKNDPLGPASGVFRARRGGSSNLTQIFARTASRLQDFPATRSNSTGFRLLCTTLAP